MEKKDFHLISCSNRHAISTKKSLELLSTRINSIYVELCHVCETNENGLVHSHSFQLEIYLNPIVKCVHEHVMIIIIYIGDNSIKTSV